MPQYVEIAVNVPQVSGVFHYHVPPELEGRLRPGHLVVVPFGKQTVQGVVLRPIAEPEVAETKPVGALLDAEAALTPNQIKLAYRIAETTLAPLAVCIGLMLPAGLSQHADTLYTLIAHAESSGDELSQIQARLIDALHKRGALRGRQLDRALPRQTWRPAAQALVRKGWLSAEPMLPPPSVRPKYVRTAQLAAPPEVVTAKLGDLSRTAAAQERREKMINFLLREPAPVDVNWVYAESGGDLADLRALEEIGLVMLREQEAWRDPLAGLAYDPSVPPQLTPDQENAWDAIRQGIEKASEGKPLHPYLLHGVTGSGKTEIYLRTVAEVIGKGKQAIVLVPEIALTPQTVRRFVARFPGRVGLIHSGLSAGELYDTWRRARRSDLSIIVGPRSALFAPLPDIALIVVDEAHDDSYYQDNHLPYYHAREAAVEYAHILGAACILGSATPDVTNYYAATQRDWQLLELPKRILAHGDAVRAQAEKLGVASKYKPSGGQAEGMDLPPVAVVDMREELKEGNRSIFSRALQHALGETLTKGEQAILFLNRRGTATYVFCRDCGEALRCPRCETPLTYHGAQAALRCHHCGYRRQMPKTCPNCGGKNIRQYGTGTERVETEAQRLFPEARILRWDYETTREKGAHDVILSHFSNHRADILVGTQMLAKGLDLPLVTLVGVVLADVGLHLPDYRAGERTFQVLTQVAGRAGRSPLGGRVVLQTFHPDHYVIQAASRHDYAGFVEAELVHRRRLGYPPYAQLLRLEYRHRQAAQAEKEAQRLAGQIRAWLKAADRRATEMIGPAPCFYARLDGQYRWQIILRGPEPASLLAGRKLGDWRIEVNPQALL